MVGKAFKRLVEFLEKGVDDKELADQLGCNTSQITLLRRRLGIRRVGEVTCSRCGAIVGERSLKRHMATMHFKTIPSVKFIDTVIKVGETYQFFYKSSWVQPDTAIVQRIYRDGIIELTDAKTGAFFTVNLFDVAHVRKTNGRSAPSNERERRV